MLNRPEEGRPGSGYDVLAVKEEDWSKRRSLQGSRTVRIRTKPIAGAFLLAPF